MTSEDMLDLQDALMDRLEQLERQNRTMRLVAILALALGAGSLGVWFYQGPGPAVAGAAGTDTLRVGVVEASEFTVIDADEQPRARLFMSEEGPLLTLHDQTGRARAGLAAVEHGPALELLSENGEVISALP